MGYFLSGQPDGRFVTNCICILTSFGPLGRHCGGGRAIFCWDGPTADSLPTASVIYQPLGPSTVTAAVGGLFFVGTARQPIRHQLHLYSDILRAPRPSLRRWTGYFLSGQPDSRFVTNCICNLSAFGPLDHCCCKNIVSLGIHADASRQENACHCEEPPPKAAARQSPEPQKPSSIHQLTL